jgi:hypothetical protein
MTEIEVAFAPTRIGARRRRLPPVAAGLAILALLVVAVAKPWGADQAPLTFPPTTATASGSATPGEAALESIPPDPGATVAAPRPIVFPGPPRPGAWGIGLATDGRGQAPTASPNWIEWVPLDPVSERPEPPIRDPLPMETGCASVSTLDVAPSIVAITAPEALSTDFKVLGWLSDGPSTHSLDGALARIDTPGRGKVAELARVDGRPWPDGRYELHVLTPNHVTALGFCLDSTGQAGPADAPDPAVTAEIVRQLSARSGAWGVGVGGNGPRLVREEPWTDWVALDPGPAWQGTSLTLWPDTGLCQGAPQLLSHPSLVAITVPAGLLPDWRVTTWWQDGSGIGSLDGVVRQISPPGNRGIAYLERNDRAPWPDGRYEFDVRAGDHETSLTACIGGH